MRAFDALTVPNLAQYEHLRLLGFDVAMGYTRVLTKEAIREALGLGMAVVPLIEHGNPTSVGYFTPAQGKADGQAFAAWAASMRMPPGVPFCGTFLDFDYPVVGDSMNTDILPFVNELINAVGLGNPNWIYGSSDVIEYALRNWVAVNGGFQARATAWAGGRNAMASGLADVVQGQNGVTISFPDGSTVPVDLSFVTSPARLWRA